MVGVDAAAEGKTWVLGGACGAAAGCSLRTPWDVAPASGCSSTLSGLARGGSCCRRAILSNRVCLEIVRRSPIVLHFFHVCFAQWTGRVLLQPLDQADEVEAQVVTWCGDGSFFDRFQADGAGLRLDMAAFTLGTGLAGGAFDVEIVGR